MEGMKGIAIVIGSLAVGFGIGAIAEIMPEADETMQSCVEIIAADDYDGFDAFRAMYGPLEYRPEGIWLDQYGREIAYSIEEDSAICVKG